MKKTILCSMLAATLLLGSFPATAMAADTPATVKNNVLDFRAQNKDVSDSEIGYHWDSAYSILTLEDFDIHVPDGALENKAAIYLPKDSTIILKGDNAILTESSHCDAIYSEGDLSISGDGKLQIQTTRLGTSAIFVEKGPLTLKDNVEINVKPADYAVYIEHAKGTDAIFSIEDEAKMTFPYDKKTADHNVIISHKTTAQPQDSWIDLVEVIDKKEKTTTLMAKEVAERPEGTPAPVVDIYQISIGSNTILKNGEAFYTADVAPYLSNGYTMLPLRALLEVTNPGLEIKWNPNGKYSYTFIDNQLVTIKPGEATFTRAAEKITLSTPVETKDGRLFVSLRDWMNIMNLSDSQLEWDRKTKTATMEY